MRRFVFTLVVMTAAQTGSTGMAGPYSPAGGEPNSTAIPATSSSIVEWASGATVVRGLVEINNPSLGYATYGGSNGANGTANTAPIGMPTQPQSTSYAVALGQGGMVTMTFAQPIANGPGPDFAVFCNGFTSGSLSWSKLGFVEVSSNGVNFFAFPSVDLNPTSPQCGSFGELDPTDIYDLAGRDPAGWGTPFDLSELAGVSPLLNVNDVTYVRVVDCVGDINPAYATYDSEGNVINGPWPAYSTLGSEGCCVAGVGVVNEAPNYNLGLATTGAGSTFGTPLSVTLFAGMSYAGLTAQTTAGPSNGSTVLGTTVTLLGGTAGAGGRTVSMAFRPRNSSEVYNPSTPYACPQATPGYYGLISDVVQLTGTGTDTYVVEMSFDPCSIIPGKGAAPGGGSWEDYYVSVGNIVLGNLNPSGIWQNAVYGNTGNSTPTYVIGAYDPNSILDNTLGTYGVDEINSDVWAVLDYDPTLAAIPEPGTMAIIFVGGPMILAIRRNKRSRTNKTPP